MITHFSSEHLPKNTFVQKLSCVGCQMCLFSLTDLELFCLLLEAQTDPHTHTHTHTHIQSYSYMTKLMRLYVVDTREYIWT